jgi:hypothetical protein
MSKTATITHDWEVVEETAAEAVKT